MARVVQSSFRGLGSTESRVMLAICAAGVTVSLIVNAITESAIAAIMALAAMAALGIVRRL